MNIGLVDVEKYNNPQKIFPNIPLMKISAWHKSIGDNVEWLEIGKHYDKVYVSKVFSFSKDFPGLLINANEVIYGGSGYAISLVAGKEIYDKEKDKPLSQEIENMFPDYELYGITDTAYGFITRGCPRGCFFCHVKDMQGTTPHRVARLSDFWNGQKNIVLLDPNITAFCGWKAVFQELIDSKAFIDFSQGLDIRCMTKEKTEMLMQMKIKLLHFAWDRYEDGKWIKPKLKEFREISNWDKNKVVVYVLTNYDTTIQQDLERVMYIRSLYLHPYIMRYDKEHIPKRHILNALARWCNMPAVFWKYQTFEEYLIKEKNNPQYYIDMLKS